MKFKSDIEVQAGLRDSSGSLGTSGQILSSTSGNVSWVTPTVNTVASDVQNQVKAGVAINKGQAVYVTGADGTNIIVGLASNASEATSSKTLGLLNATVATNGFADVVQIGRLAGLNTLGANAGDPVWLGTSGNLIYGLANKPYAPAHLVFLGIVTRVNSNNGEIFVNVQNGFELKEIHDVDIITNVPINGDVLGYDGTLWVNKTIAEWLGYTPANASGTTNYVSKFTGTTTLGDSLIYDNGSRVAIGTSSPPNARLSIYSSFSNDYGIYTTGEARNLISADLGIGTTTPAHKLDVNGAINTNKFLRVGDSSTLIGAIGSEFGIFGTGGNDWTFYNGGATSNVFYTSGTERMRITSSGDVGIGTSSPATKFEVSGRALVNQFQYTRALNISSANLNDYTFAGFYNGEAMTNAPNSGWFWVTVERYSGDANWVHQTATSFGSGNTANEVYTRTNSGGTWTNWKRLIDWTDINGTTNYVSKFTGNNSIGNSSIYDNGTNVGIGTSSPSAKLNVSGDIHLGDYGTAASRLLDFRTSNSLFSITTDGTSGGLGTTLTYSWAGGGHGPLKFNNASGEVMRLTSTGNVGIGTTSPSEKFEVQNSASGAKIKVSNTGGGFASLECSSNATSVAQLSFTNQLSLIGGNVGIGTTNPTFKLQVIDGTLFVGESSGAGSNQMGRLSFGSTGIGGGYTNYGGQIASYSGSGIDVSDLRFYTGNGSVSTERMRITSSGNVGIGTTSPSGRLQVSSATAGDDQIWLQSTTYTGGYSTLGYNANTGEFRIKQNDGGSAGITFYTGASASEKMRITPSGNVCIGTTSALHTLSVAGTIGGNTYGDSFVEFAGSGNTLVKANDNVILGYSQSTAIKQNGSVGIGTTTPDASAILQLDSTTQGFLLPRMGNTDMVNISSPAQGLMVFNTDNNVVCVYDGSTWQRLAYI